MPVVKLLRCAELVSSATFPCHATRSSEPRLGLFSSRWLHKHTPHQTRASDRGAELTSERQRHPQRISAAVGRVRRACWAQAWTVCADPPLHPQRLGSNRRFHKRRSVSGATDLHWPLDICAHAHIHLREIRHAVSTRTEHDRPGNQGREQYVGT